MTIAATPPGQGGEPFAPELFRKPARRNRLTGGSFRLLAGSFTETTPLSRPRSYRPSTNAPAQTDDCTPLVEERTRTEVMVPTRQGEKENPPAIIAIRWLSVTSLSVDEMPCRAGCDSVLPERCAANGQTASASGRALPQASRSQLHVMPDFSPKSAAISGPLPRRRIDVM